MQISYDPVIPLLDIYPMGKKNPQIQKDTAPLCLLQHYQHYHSPNMEAIQLSISRQMLSHKRMKSCHLQQHGPREYIMLSETSQTQIDKCHMISLICGI